MADQYDLLDIRTGLALPLRCAPPVSTGRAAGPSLGPLYAPTSGVNYRHIGTNGDGLVSTADTWR